MRDTSTCLFHTDNGFSYSEPASSTVDSAWQYTNYYCHTACETNVHAYRGEYNPGTNDYTESLNVSFTPLNSDYEGTLSGGPGLW